MLRSTNGLSKKHTSIFKNYNHYHKIKEIILFSFTLFSYSYGLQAESAEIERMESQLYRIFSHHPEIISLEESAKSFYFDKETKNILPDPKIGFAYRSFPVRGRNPLNPDLSNREDTPGMTGRELSLSQEIPYPEKLQSEKKVSYWNYRNEKERIHILKNEFLREFFLTLIEKQILEKELKDWASVQKVQKALSRISNAGFASGRESTFSALRDKNDNTKIQDKLIELETRIEEVNASLAYFLNSKKYPKKTEVERLDLEKNISGFLERKINRLLSKVNENPSSVSQKNPNTKLYETNIQLAKELERRDDLNYFPDAEVFIAYLQRNSRLFRVSQNPLNIGGVMPTEEFTGDLVSFGVTLSIPTWSWTAKKDYNRKNRAERNKTLQAREAIEKKITVEISRLTRSIEGADRRIQYYKTDLLPTLQRSARISSGGTTPGSDTSTILRLRLEYQLALAELNDLHRKRYQSIIQLLELSDELLPNKKDSEATPATSIRNESSNPN